MAARDYSTELLIKETAKKMFLTEGKMMATTQEIADAAGVNRSLLHYYFRSRDVLFNLVFREALDKLRIRLQIVLLSPLELREKVEKLIDAFFEELTESPYLETFIVLQLNEDASRFHELFKNLPGGENKTEVFFKQIEDEMNRGRLAKGRPIHFFMNLFALMAYPFLAKPMYQKMFNLNDEDYVAFLQERKEVILSLLFIK